VVDSNCGQMKIMQMMFMIVAVFFFFVLVGLFFLGIAFKDVRASAENLEKKQAISSLEVIAGMGEFTFNSRESMMLDEDKLTVMSGGFGNQYALFLPVNSLRVYKVYPVFGEEKKCPGVGCNYYEIVDSGERDALTYSSFVSICRRIREFQHTYDKCEVGKIVVGTRQLGVGND
jgi:hypothetical protein